MILLECSPPFQWRPSHTKFGDFGRFMWGWFAITIYRGGINELVEGLAQAGAQMYVRGEMKLDP